MKKLLFSLLVLLTILTGCHKASEEDIKLEKYAYIYRTISDNDSFMSNSDKYDISVTMSKDSNNFLYYITIDNPKIAMYEIQVMAVENNIEYQLADKMMPTLGILDNEVYNMVPNQVDSERGYHKGIILSGTTSDKILNLKIRIAYKDYLLVDERQDYISITVDYDSLMQNNEVLQDVPVVDENSQETGNE